MARLRRRTRRKLSKRMRRSSIAARFQSQDTWTRFKAGVGLLTLVLIAGTVGYVVLGLSVGQAIYQTVITISTVGYGEVGEVTRAYKVFTVGLIMLGTGTALYTLGVLIETIFEGRLEDPLRRKRMQAEIDRLSGHVILAGFGQVGRAIYDNLTEAGCDVVVIDRHALSADHHLQYSSATEVRYLVVGEATDDDILAAAGLERASTLVLALDSDVDNLFVVLTARTLVPGLTILARANNTSAEPKLRQAGADHVVNPHRIGGSKMAELVTSD